MTERILRCTAPEILSTPNYEDIPQEMREQLEKDFPRGMGCEGGLVPGWWCLGLATQCKYLEEEV